MVKTNSPSLKVPHKSAPAAGDLPRFPCTGNPTLLPARTPVQAQSQLSSPPASITNGGPGRGEPSQLKRCLLDAVTERLFCSTAPAFWLGVTTAYASNCEIII